MITYYAVCCDRCKTVFDLVRRIDGAWDWMPDASDKIPGSIARHSGHIESLHVISEQAPRWAQYQDETIEDKIRG